MKRRKLKPTVQFILLASTLSLSDVAWAQQAPAPAPLPEIEVTAPKKSSSKKTPAISKSVQKAAKATQPRPITPATPPVVDPLLANDPSSTQSATGPVEGFVATNSATATKTNTPLIETPQSISVITADQIKQQGVESLPAALRYTAGVTAEPFGLDPRDLFIRFRGFDGGSGSVYRDGLPLGGSDFSGFTGFDLYGIERLEVFKGPTSVLYGQNGPGGLINFVSKKPTVAPLRELEFTAGSHDNFGAKFDFSGPVNANKSVLYRVTGVVRDSETQVDYVDADRFYIAPALTFRPSSATTLTILANYQFDDTGWTSQFLPARGTNFANINGKLPVSRFLSEPGYDTYDTTQYAAGYLFEHKASDIWTLRQNARYARLDNEQGLVYKDPQLGLEADQRTLNRIADLGRTDLEVYTVDNQAQAKVRTGAVEHTVLFGVDYKFTDYYDFGADGPADPIDIFNPVYGGNFIADTPYQDARSRQHQTGLYVQEQLKLGGLVVTLGGRQDWASTATDDYLNGVNLPTQRDDAFTGRAGAVYLFDSGFAPYVSYSESFKPTTGFDNAGNALVPETGQQTEVGIKYQPPGLNAFVTVAGFELTRQNVVTTSLNDPTDITQTGELRSRGIEVEGAASVNNWDLRVAYAYLDLVVTKDNDLPIGSTPYGVPKHQFSGWADYTFRDGFLAGFGLGGGVRYLGSNYANDDNTLKVRDATLFDAAVHYDWRQYRLSLNVSNLADKAYVAACDGGLEGACYYGTDRTFLATLRMRW